MFLVCLDIFWNIYPIIWKLEKSCFLWMWLTFYVALTFNVALITHLLTSCKMLNKWSFKLSEPTMFCSWFPLFLFLISDPMLQMLPVIHILLLQIIHSTISFAMCLHVEQEMDLSLCLQNRALNMNIGHLLQQCNMLLWIGLKNPPHPHHKS